MAVINFPYWNSLYSNPLLSSVGSLFVAVIVISVIISFQRKHAAYGFGNEREEEYREGLAPYGKLFRQIERKEEALALREHAIQAAESREEGPARGNKPELKAVKAIERGAEAAQHEENAEYAATAVEGRVLGMVASILSIARAVKDLNIRKKSSIATEEYEVSVFNQIMAKIKNTINYHVIDSRITDYLNQLWHTMIKMFTFDYEAEGKKVEFLSNFADRMREAVVVMKKDIKYARQELKRLRKEEKKTWTHFNNEVYVLKSSLRAKKKELKRLRKGNATAQVIASLQQEIALRSQQYAKAKALDNQIEETYAFMRKCVKEMMRLLKYILSNEKQLAAFEHSIEKRKLSIVFRAKRLGTALNVIKSVESLFRQEKPNPHEIALLLSGRINTYFAEYKAIVEEDILFDSSVKDITIKNFVIARQLKAFQLFEVSLRKCERAVEIGIESLTQLISSVVEDEQSKARVDIIILQLKRATTLLGYEESIEQFIQNLTSAIQKNSNALSIEIEKLIEEDKTVLAGIKADEQSNSSDIGSAMAAAVQKKIAVDQKYWLEYQTKFGNQLKRTNQSVYNSYQLASRQEALAPAA